MACSAYKDAKLVLFESMPVVAICDRLGGDHNQRATGIDGVIKPLVAIYQSGAPGLAGLLCPVEIGAAVGEHHIANGQQEIEGAMGGNISGHAANFAGQRVKPGAGVTKSSHQFRQQKAERGFTVGLSIGFEARIYRRLEIMQITVVGKHPVIAPQLAAEGVAIDQLYRPKGGLADMGDQIAGENIPAQKRLGLAAIEGTGFLDIQVMGAIGVIGNAPAILVITGTATAAQEATQGLLRGNRTGTVQTEDLAHGSL